MANTFGRITTPSLEEYGLPAAVQLSVAQLQPTERPIEDRFSVHFKPDIGRLIVGVYDGHGGPDTADYISKALPRKLLSDSPTRHAQHFLQLDDAILSDFRRDHSMFRKRSSDWVQHALLIKSGCTALVLDIDTSNLLGHYANAGDCRLVICNNDPHQAELLYQTEDLNAKTTSERARLAKEHPNEDLLIVGDRLFGRLMTTRGFGDGYYKLPRGGPFGDGQHRQFIQTLSTIERPGKIPMIDQYGPLFHAYKTPPYLTALPQTGTYQLKTGDVAILASDGLWDLVSSAEAIEIVGRGIANRESHLAKYLLEQAKEKQAPGDDVTIIVLQLQQPVTDPQ